MRICLNFETRLIRCSANLNRTRGCIPHRPALRGIYAERALTIRTDGVSGVVSNRSDRAIRKRTPLEQAIAEEKDPRVRWDAKMRAKGFRRTTIMVHESKLEAVKVYVAQLNEEAKRERGE